MRCCAAPRSLAHAIRQPCPPSGPAPAPPLCCRREFPKHRIPNRQPGFWLTALLFKLTGMLSYAWLKETYNRWARQRILSPALWPPCSHAASWMRFPHHPRPAHPDLAGACDLVRSQGVPPPLLVCCRRTLVSSAKALRELPGLAPLIPLDTTLKVRGLVGGWVVVFCTALRGAVLKSSKWIGSLSCTAGTILERQPSRA